MAVPICRQCLQNKLSTNAYAVIRLSSGVAVSQTNQHQDDFSSGKPFSAMPHPPQLPVIGSLWRLPWIFLTTSNPYDAIFKDFARYGPIYRDKQGIMEYVLTSDADALERVHRADRKFPGRMMVDAWVQWREERGHDKGILIESDPARWRRMRTQLDKHLLRPRHVAGFADDFCRVSADFIERLRRVRDPEAHTVKAMDKELFNWSLETIGTVLYEKRFGNFSDVRDPDSDAFIQAVNDMFLSTAYVAYFPPSISKRFFRKYYDMHWNGWDVIFSRGQQTIAAKLSELEARVARGQQVEGFLTTLLANSAMSLTEISANIAELMAAAVDTTSNATQWCIERLAWHPEVQEKLRQEVVSVVPPGSEPTYNDINNMPYLRAFTKEVLRLYPIAGVVTKIAQQDLVLCGYQVPKGTCILGSTMHMGRNPANFPDPLRFDPGRWLRGAAHSIHPFSWLPFGHGPRMCVGRRISELEMHILLTKMCQEFKLVPAEKKMRKPGGRSLIVPKDPVNVRFIDRK